MRHEPLHKGRTRVHWAWALALLILTTPALWAAEDLSGDWKISSDFNGRTMVSTLSLAQKADGTWTGKWGASELSSVKFDGQKLGFVRTIKFGDNEFSMTFNGTLKEGKIAGTLSSDQGDSTVTAVRKKVKSPILGQWNIKFNVGDRDIDGLLTLTEKPDGTLAGQWTKEEGQHVISNVKFQDGKLTFTRKVKLQDMDEFETNYEGTLKEGALTGSWKSEMGEIPANGQRAGGALIGKWELTVTSDRGTRTSLLVVDGDMTGTFESFGGEVPLKDLKLQGDQVTFNTEVSFNDQTFKRDFKAKLDGKTLKGQITSDQGTSEVTGKKLEAAPAPAAASAQAPAAKSAPAGLVGTWELTTTGQDGTPRTNTLKINADMTGTYTGRNNETPIKEIKVDGNQVSFKFTRSFNDQEVTMEFKGKLEGSTLNGEFTSDRGTRPVTGKKVN